MAGSRYIDAVGIGAGLLAVLAAVAFLVLGSARQADGAAAGKGQKDEGIFQAYETRLFDDSRVHHINIQVGDWEAFLENAQEEQYTACTAVVDGEEFRQVGLRAKGNNSLHLTGDYGLRRYSLKLEFDHFLEGGSYHGLDKFSLDASFQDNSYMKTWLTYDMMEYMGVPSPLCSFVWVQVNGADWGLFLAVEEPEEGFARRNFGMNHGQLYKPDYRSLNAENADVALRYIGRNPESYPNIFENAKLQPSEADKRRLVRALEILSTGVSLETAVDVDEVLRYFAVQVFVMNWDSYLGHTGHNYFLYEEDGILHMLPWDYNLAFGTYALGMPNPIKDAEVLINAPINTPAEGSVMLKRPLYHNLMKNQAYFSRYHGYLGQLISGYFESRKFDAAFWETARLISPYVEKDPTAFCSYEDHQLAVRTLEQVCLLRAESVRRQLAGDIPATIRGQQEEPGRRVKVSEVRLEDLGDFDDLRWAAQRQRGKEGIRANGDSQM